MTTIARTGTLLAALAVAAGCGGGEIGTPDTGLEGAALTGLAPATILPGTRLVVEGEGFVAEPWATSSLRLKGSFSGDGGSMELDVTAPARFVDFEHLEVTVGAELIGEL